MIYHADNDEPVWTCTTTTVDGEALYYDYANDAWSHDPDVGCDLAVSADPPPLPIDYRLVCAVSVTLLPPEGDVPGLWDCPPYGN